MNARWAAVGLLLLAPAAGAGAADPQATRDPNELGRVAVVPFLDLSGERQEARDEYRETALGEVEERFRRYEIRYVPREEMHAALGALGLSPGDEEDRTRARMKQLADHLKVRWIITGVIHGADSEVKRRGVFGGDRKTGQARVQLRVFDAESGRYDERREATATATVRAGAFSGIATRSNKLRVKAVRDATKKAMEPFLKPYPKVHAEDPAAR